MSGTPHPTPEAASPTLAALERYQLHVRQLATRRGDAELFHTVALDIQEVRRCCHEIPALSAPWVALLIAHAELSQTLWRSDQARTPVDAQERQRLLANVLDNVRALQQHCMELSGPPGPGSHCASA